jgi:integrase
MDEESGALSASVCLRIPPLRAATLLLKARIPVHVVSERLGHSKVSMTMEIYAHVLPDMHQEAATALGAILHG